MTYGELTVTILPEFPTLKIKIARFLVVEELNLMAVILAASV